MGQGGWVGVQQVLQVWGLKRVLYIGCRRCEGVGGWVCMQQVLHV